MAKRPLGISKSNRAKKLKKEQSVDFVPSSKEGTPQLTLEIEENEDPENEITQLKALWKSYCNSTRDSDALLNGIINECNALMKVTEDEKTLESEFLAIFALALSEITIFKYDSEDEDIHDYFERAMSLIEIGLHNDNKNILLNLVLSKIIFQRIPLEFISKLTIDSDEKKMNLGLFELLQRGMNSFIINSDDLELSYEILNSFDDLLDIIENFGNEKAIEEGLDSDNEDEDNAENFHIKLKSNHVLFDIKEKLSEYYQWLKIELVKLFEVVENNKEKENPVYHSIAKSIGELFLKDAEPQARTFMDLRYGNDDDEEVELNEEDEKLCEESQKQALQSTKNALKYLEKAQLPDDTDSWVEVAEAYIDLGNLHDFKSKEQEEAYAKAETLLKKANVASHDKYEDILVNLLGKN